jgi:hypothetical protein
MIKPSILSSLAAHAEQTRKWGRRKYDESHFHLPHFPVREDYFMLA